MVYAWYVLPVASGTASTERAAREAAEMAMAKPGASIAQVVSLEYVGGRFVPVHPVILGARNTAGVFAWWDGKTWA